MDTKQRHPIDQNLKKLAETAGFADIYTHKVKNTDNKIFHL